MKSDPNLRDCSRCGMPREDWTDDAASGYSKDGSTYCCRGCVEGPECTCPPVETRRAPTRQDIRHDRASGDFVRSLQTSTTHIGPEDYGTGKLTTPPRPSYSND